MAFMRKCCCCCDLRTGVLVIGILTIIGAGYNVVTQSMSMNKLDEAREYFRNHPDDTEKYGFSESLLDGVEVSYKVGIGASAISLVAAICLIIPACFQQRENARPYRRLVFVYVIWEIAYMLVSLGLAAWILAKFTNPIVAAALIVSFGISIPLLIYFVIVAIAFFIELGEDPTVTGGVIVQQSEVPYGQFQNEAPPQYPGAYPPQPYAQYPQKQGGVV